MASEFVNAYLKKREEEKQTGAAPAAGGRTPFAQEYLKQRYAGGTVPTVQREDASDVYFDFATGKSYSASARAAERARQAALISPASMRGALNRASSLQAEADRYKNTLLREPEKNVLMPDYGAIDAESAAREQLQRSGIRRHEAESALKRYQAQYGAQMDQYGPFLDASGQTIQQGMGALQMKYDQENQAYEDALADYQKKQQAANAARAQEEKRKALQAEAASYQQMTAQKESAEQAAQDAWSEYYAMIPRAEDFASNQKNAYSRSSYADRMDKITSNKYSEEDQIRDLVMTDEELAIMTYLRNTQGEDAAQRYYNSLGLNERLKEHWENAFFEYGDENPVGASVVSTWHNLANEVYGPIGIAKAKLSGQELDSDADYFKYGKLRDAARAGVMQDMGPVGQFVYQTLMSAGVDSGVNTLIGLGTGLGWASAGLTGLSGFSDMVRTVKERGASDTQALVLGTIEGLAEVVTEKMGFDRIADLLTSKAVSKDLLKKVLANTLSEMGEEGSTTVINQTADWLYGVISGEETEFTQRIDDYMAEGQTESQALGHALLDMAGDVGLDALGGALGGFVLGGASAVTNQALARVDAKLAERGNRETRETAQEAAGAPLGADNQTDSRRAETAQAGAQAADTRVAALARETVAEEMQAERAERVARTRGTQEALRQAGEAYGRDAASFERHYTGGDVAQYRRAFDAVYQAGKVNLSMEQVSKTGGELLRGLSEQARQEIWRAGRRSALTTVVPGVSRQYTQAMNSTQRAQLRFLDAVGRKYGIQFDVVDSLSGAGANAALAGRNHIVVAADATDGAYVQAGVHELVHNLQREGGEYYQAFEGMVVEVLKKQDGFDLDAAVTQRLREYQEQGVTLTREAALEEVVAEAAPVALTDEAAMRAFVKENRSLAEKIRDFFVRFAKTLREIAAGYGFDNEREEVGVMLKAATQDLVDVAETLDMALSATQERGAAEGAAAAQRAQMESTGIELQSLTKYSLKDRNVIEGYLDAVDQEVLEAAQTYREDKNAKFRRIKLGDVQQREAEAIKGLLGVDVSGYDHAINTNGFKHIESRHGVNGENDHSMADLNDVARMGWVLKNYDSVEILTGQNGEQVFSEEFQTKNGKNAPMVLYKKKINGAYYIAEAVVEGKWKRVWVVTAYINQKADITRAPDASFETPRSTSETAPASLSASASVADSDAAVNPSAQISQEQRELSDGETRFSLKRTSALNQDTQLLLEGEDVRVDAQSVQAYARDALRAADRSDVRINQQVRQAAGKILRDTRSKYDRKTLEGNLREIVAEYAKNGADNLAITYASAELGKAIIEQNTHLDNTLREQYADLRTYLRETGVALTDDQKREAAALYGSYNDFRRALMGTVKITDKRTTLDAQWEELSARYPEIFPEHTNVGDQVAALIDFKEMMQPVYINDYGMDVELAAVDLGLRIQGDALAIAGAKEASRALYGSAAAIETRVKKRYDQQLTAQKRARVAQFQEIASRLAEAKKTGDADGYDAAMTAYRQLIGRETGVRVPTGGGLSESVKMRFSEISERMHTALAADDTAAYKRALTEYKALLRQERIQSTVVAPAVREALGEARARVQANREAREATLGRQKATRRVMKQANDLIDYLANRKKGVRVPRMMQESLLSLLEGLDVNGQNAARRGEETLAAQAVREQLTALRRSYQEIWASQSRGEAPDLLGGLMMTMSEEQYTQLTDALDILDKGGRYTLREMNAEQLNALGDALTTVKRTIATIGRLWRRGRYQSVADLGDASIREMNERPAARYDASGAAGAARDFLALDMLEPVSYGERLGEAGSEIIRGLYDGERVKFTRLREAQEATSGMLERVGATGYDIGQWRRQVHTVRLGGREVRLTATQAMDIYLTAQRPQGRGHMLGDGIRLKSTRATGQQVYTVRLQEADLATIEGLLTDKQRAMAREMQAYLAGDVAKWGNDVTQQLYLYDYFTENTYWPLTSDPNVLKTTEPTADRSLTALVQPGFMKPLTKGASNPVIIMDAFDVFSRHVAEMASYNGLALPMTDALGYMNYKQRSEEGELTGSVKESMERLLGSKGGGYLVTLIQDLNHARHGDDLTALSGLTSHYKKAAVTGKIRVVIQQPTAIARAAQEISPVYLLRGLKLGSSADIAEMEAHSALAWWKNNGSGSDIGVGRGADQLLWGDVSRAATIEDKISTAGGLIDANRADAVTWAAMWRAVKRETERLHPELTRGSDAYFQAVTERFDAIMDKTQVVDSIMHRSQIMRSQNALAREMTAFQAEPIKSYNMLARAAMELGRRPQSRQAQRTAVRAVLVFAANAALTALAQAAFDVFKHRDDDDTLGGYLLDAQDGFLKEYTDEFLASWLDNMNVIAMIPFVSQTTEVLTGGDAPELMSFEGMGDALQAANTFLDHFGENNKKTTLYGAVAPVLKAASQLTGLPIAGVLANTEMLAKIADPQYLSYRAVSGKYRDNYEALYAAMLKGDTRAAGRIRARLAAESQGDSAKSPKEIDMGVASVLSERDERIAQAYALRASGQAKQLVALKKQIMADGFSDAIVTAAINRYKPQEEAAPRQKDMNEQLAARLFTYDNLFAAVRGGTLEDVGVILEALQADSTAKDPAAAIKSQLSGQFKQEYVDAVSAGRDVTDLKRKLMSAGYTEDELAKWVKSGRYEALKDAVGEADIAGAKRVAQELLDSGADVSSVVSSLNSRYRDVYVELVKSGRVAEAARLQQDLESLGLVKKKTGENYYRKEYMDGWVG